MIIKHLVKVLLPLAIGFIVFTVSCKSNADKDKIGVIINAEEFEKKIKETENLQIIDVRTPEEYMGGHIKNAKNINWNGSEFEADIQKIDKSTNVFIYCLSGGRSSSAVSKMKELGFKKIYELEGGIRSWHMANKPLEESGSGKKSEEMSINEFREQLKTNKLVLVDFNAEWCGPCKKIAPILDEIANEFKDKLVLIKIDTDKHVALSNEMKIESLPTLIVYKNEKIVWTKIGLTEKKEIVEVINKN